jgi:transcriptional regulator
MYIPAFNRVHDQGKINAFLHTYGFAVVITQENGLLQASHLPVLFDENADGPGTLRSHMARANEQWKQFHRDLEILCIFQGPHAYISPSSYVMQHTVPTWNYAAIHVYGRPEIVGDAELKQIVRDTTHKYESGRAAPWSIPLSDSEMEAMCKAIVGFKIEITRVEAKFKLGQNRSAEDRAGMLEALQKAPECGSRELAMFMMEQFMNEKENP